MLVRKEHGSAKVRFHLYAAIRPAVFHCEQELHTCEVQEPCKGSTKRELFIFSSCFYRPSKFFLEIFFLVFLRGWKASPAFTKSIYSYTLKRGAITAQCSYANIYTMFSFHSFLITFR